MENKIEVVGKLEDDLNNFLIEQWKIKQYATGNIIHINRETFTYEDRVVPLRITDIMGHFKPKRNPEKEN